MNNMTKITMILFQIAVFLLSISQFYSVLRIAALEEAVIVITNSLNKESDMKILMRCDATSNLDGDTTIQNCKTIINHSPNSRR